MLQIRTKLVFLFQTGIPEFHELIFILFVKIDLGQTLQSGWLQIFIDFSRFLLHLVSSADNSAISSVLRGLFFCFHKWLEMFYKGEWEAVLEVHAGEEFHLLCYNIWLDLFWTLYPVAPIDFEWTRVIDSSLRNEF